MPDLPLRNLTIYLIKPELQPNSIIRKIESRRYQSFDINDHRYRIYAKRLEYDLPEWEGFFEGRLSKEFVGESDSPGVVLLVNVGGPRLAAFRSVRAGT